VGLVVAVVAFVLHLLYQQRGSTPLAVRPQ
jgi:hypothetical protein